MELIVINIGYQLGVIPPSLYTVLVVMATADQHHDDPLLGSCCRDRAIA